MSRTVIEALDQRLALAVTLPIAINFQPATASTPTGYVADVGKTYGDRGSERTFGWSASNSANPRDRNNPNSPNQAYDTVTFFKDTNASATRTWEIALPNGSYNVKIVAGDPCYDTGPQITAEGVTILSGNATISNRWITGTKTITISDGRLTLSAKSGSTSRTPINFIEIKKASSTPITWPTSWSSGASSPINRFESHGISDGGKLYVFGGWADSNFKATKRVDVYDPAKNTWKRLADMKAPETHTGAALDAAKGVIYFVGGDRGNYPSYRVRDVWKYTIATDSWTKLSAQLPYAASAGAAAVIGSKLYYFGGVKSDRVTNTSDNFVLDLNNISAGFKKLAGLPTARDHLSTVTLGGKIYAFGGEIGHDKKHDQQNLLHRYDPATNTWTKLASAPISKSHAESSAFVHNGKIIWAGGQKDPQAPTSNVVQYDPATGKWSTLASLPTARQGVVVAPVGDYMVITTGGINTNQPQKTTWRAKIS